MINMKIEKFEMQHYQETVELWRKVGIGIGSSDTKDEVEAVLTRNPNLFLIGKKDGKIISSVIGTSDGRRGYVHHLAVDPSYQKKGYGKKIMEELIEIFRDMKVHKIHLLIQKTNRKVVKFYSKLGWETRDDLFMMSYVPNKKLYKRNL